MRVICSRAHWCALRCIWLHFQQDHVHYFSMHSALYALMCMSKHLCACGASAFLLSDISLHSHAFNCMFYGAIYLHFSELHIISFWVHFICVSFCHWCIALHFTGVLHHHAFWCMINQLHYAALCCISMHFDAFWCILMRYVRNATCSECIRMYQNVVCQECERNPPMRNY